MSHKCPVSNRVIGARTFLSHAARNWNLVWRVAAGQIRRPKESRNPKAETRIALGTGFRSSDSGTRPSFASSGFGLRSYLTPALAPGEGALSVVVRDVWLLRFVAPRPIVLPLLWGAGRGEGERGRRTDAAAQNVAGTRETEPQSLAALDSPSPDISQAARNTDRPERRLSAGLSRSTATRGANRPPPFSLAALRLAIRSGREVRELRCAPTVLGRRLETVGAPRLNHV